MPGAIFLSRVTFLVGSEENDIMLVVKLLRLFSFPIFLPQKEKVLLCNYGVESSLEEKKLSDV